MQEIQQTQADFDAFWSNPKLGGTESDKAYNFTLFGYKTANDACQTFFDRIHKLQSETTFAKDTLVAASAAAGVIAGLSGATANVMTALFAGTGLIPSTVDNFNKIFLLAGAADELAGQVLAGMTDYQKSNPASGTLTKEAAINNVRANAQWCSIAFMTFLVRESVKGAEIKNVSGNGTGTTTGSTTTTTTTTGGPPLLGSSGQTTQTTTTRAPKGARFGGIEIIR